MEKMGRENRDTKHVTREAEEVTPAVDHCRDAYLRLCEFGILNSNLFPPPSPEPSSCLIVFLS
jgi:hypothetical protein